MKRSEALEIVRRNWPKDIQYSEALHTLIPELKESEDEIIRKALVELVRKHCVNETRCMMERWLEKQGSQNLANSAKTCKDEQNQPTKYTLEQAARIFLDALSDTPYNNKPVTDAQVITKELLKFLSDAHSYNPNAINEQNPAWSEEDEIGFCDAMWAIEQARTIAKNENDMGNLWYAERWLKFLKSRVQPQPKSEWSEDDEKEFEQLLDILHANGYESFDIWLKSLKDRYTWKPSDEQIKALGNSTGADEKQSKALYSLLNDLKKLKG